MNVMYLVKHVATTGRKNLEPLPDVFPDLLRRRSAQHFLGVAPAAQNTILPPNSLFSLAGSIFAAEVWTGFKISMPASMKWGIRL